METRDSPKVCEGQIASLIQCQTRDPVSSKVEDKNGPTHKCKHTHTLKSQHSQEQDPMKDVTQQYMKSGVKLTG